MKRIYNYILVAAFSVAVASCFNEELNPDKPSAESGDDVQFGLTLGDPETKTVYGDEANNAFPIYWINGDKVQIFSPQCLDGRRSAEYEVSVSEPQNYADALNKTGEYGIQWGDSDKAIFYSLYPSGAYTLSSDGKEALGITINYSQNIIVNGSEVKSDMEDCLMYAKNDGGKDNEFKGVTRGNTVNLKYNPISTVFMVTLKVASNSADDFTIQSVSLVAPAETNIAGTFSLNIADGSFGKFADGKSSNSVSTQISDINTGGYYTLGKGKYVEIPLFLAPVAGLNTDGWKIKVKANNNEYTKTLTAQDIVAGQIHKVTLPLLSTTATEWETDKWMENIPRNVYLSEVSIPGSWNTINDDYQSEIIISKQYEIGVRAFHLDTRWRTDDTSVSGTGYLEGSINGLSVAGGAASGKYQPDEDDGRVVSGGAKTFAEYLKDITDNIVDNTGVTKEEYMVVMCTFAQDSYDYTDSEGDNWVAEISDACTSNNYIYDAKLLSANTLVGDVLGKVIVIINMEGAVTSVPTNSKCLFVNLPLTLTSDLFGTTLNEKNSGTIYKANATTAVDSGIDMYHTQAQISIESDEVANSHNRTNVMDRGFAPTYSERKTVAENILNWSRTNYGTDNFVHDKWIYLGLGGYYAYWNYGLFGIGARWDEDKGSNATVASSFNAWINGKVSEMGTTPVGQSEKIKYYPVGIVLMNSVNNYESTIENILLLNNKYRLQYDPNKPADYNPSVRTRSAAPSYSSGMNDTDVAAFGWD